MDQIKIGRFIAENRKKQNLTQEQLSEQLGISKNAVSKWERGLNLPDVSKMQELCSILNITLNELFIGERIPDENYKEVADTNLKTALENSSFTLNERMKFYKNKWRKEHIFDFIIGFIVWLSVILFAKSQDATSALIGFIGGGLGVIFYFLYNNQMMKYVEDRVFGDTK